MARNFPRNRQGLPAGSVVGRLNGTGNAQIIPLAQAIQQALQSGTIPLPASGPFTSAVLDALFGTTEGAIIQRGPSVWQILLPGTNGQVLTSQGAGALNKWAAASGGSAPNGMLPLVTGETPGPIPIADGNGQYIGVPL